MRASILPVIDGVFQYNNGLKPGGRRPHLWLLTKYGQVVVFKGLSIDRVCHVVATESTRNGKWSSTTYHVRVGTALPILLLAPLHQKVWQDVGTWRDAECGMQELCGDRLVDWASFRAVLREEYPETAARLDAADAAPELE